MRPNATNPGEVPAPRDRLCLFDEGFLYACPGLVSRTQRHAATLLIALGDAPLLVEGGGQRGTCAAVAVRPSAANAIHAPAVPVACVDVGPSHRHYRSFVGIGAPGWMALPPRLFEPLLPALRDFHAGRLDPAAARAVFDESLARVAGMSPAPRPLDARVAGTIARLGDDLHATQHELAAAACLSYDRLSHLFSRELGMSLRRYVQWLKLREAARYRCQGMSLTQIAAAAGFCDSAHFSKVWMQSYGTSPAYFFLGGAVGVRYFAGSGADDPARRPTPTPAPASPARRPAADRNDALWQRP